ncbi:MAG TPA: DNA polymerase Y family protein [Steroidobacteraceae bacterium]|nr:DNA polymerase Y family protein [Steroidobacteraceae bacterium]
MRAHIVSDTTALTELLLQQPSPASPQPQPTSAPPRVLARTVVPAARLAPELWAALHLPGCDTTEKLQQLAMRAQRFTPRVSLVAPDGLLLEVKGSLELFAGVAGLGSELINECLPLQLRPVLAFAPTPLAALTAARAGKPLVITDTAQLTGQLASLPLAALRWPEETLARLARTGVRTIGAALRLPRAGFARRFGVAQLAMLDALTGRTRDVRAAYQARERFRRRRELDCELTDHQLLLAILTPLFSALGEFLTARQCGVLQLECRLLHRQGQVTRCVLSLAAACANGPHLAALFGERLSTLCLPAPVRACELRADELVPHQQDSHSLWQPGEHGGDAAAVTEGLIERLRARLGPEAIHGLALCEGHRPEKAWAVSPAPIAGQRRTPLNNAAANDTPTPNGAEALPPRRPLWLLPEPQSLAVQDGLPCRCGPLRLMSEPERIESGWWDGEEVARDYYHAVDMHGERLWVFRERAAPHGWFLHGVFG